jgi:hypothetical protein
MRVLSLIEDSVECGDDGPGLRFLELGLLLGNVSRKA